MWEVARNGTKKGGGDEEFKENIHLNQRTYKGGAGLKGIKT